MIPLTVGQPGDLVSTRSDAQNPTAITYPKQMKTMANSFCLLEHEHIVLGGRA